MAPSSSIGPGAGMNGAGSSTGPGAAAADNFQSFPAVAPHEAAALISDLGVPTTADDIAHPTPQFVAKVFGVFLETLNGVSLEWIDRQRDAICGQLEYREIYEEGVHHMLMFREIRAMMQHATISDFVMADLTKPVSKRLKRQLSALVNFYRFRQDRIEEFDDAAAEGEQLVQQREELLASVESLRTRLAEEKAQREEEKPRMQGLVEENVVLSDRLMELKKEQGTLMQEHDLLKTEKGDLAERQMELQLQLQLVTADVRKLTSRIRLSPVQLKNSVMEIEAQLKGDRITLHETERKHKDLQAKLQVLKVLEADMDEAQRGVEAVVEQLAKCDAEMDAMERMRSAIAEARHEVEGLEHRREQYHRTSSALATRIERLRKTIDDRREEHAKRRAELVELLQSTSEGKRQRMEQASKLEMQANEVESQYTDLMRAFDAHVHSARKERDVMVARAESYMQQIEQRFRMPV